MCYNILVNKRRKEHVKIMGLKLENVKKNYGEKIVVDGVSFEMNKPRRFWFTSEQMVQEKLQQLECYLE